MTTWDDFAGQAPTISTLFRKRHRATGALCMLGTTRSDGYPRISPMEPQIFEGQLILLGMPGTRKFADLARDPRFCLHTATVDTHVKDGDVKLWGEAINNHDRDFHRRFTDDLFERTGFDLRDRDFDFFYIANLTGAASVTIERNKMTVTSWKPGQVERIRRR